MADRGEGRHALCVKARGAAKRRPEEMERVGVQIRSRAFQAGCYRLFISVTSIADAVRCHTVARLWTARPGKLVWKRTILVLYAML